MFDDEPSDGKNGSGSKDEKIAGNDDPADRKFASEKDMVSVPVTGSAQDRVGGDDRESGRADSSDASR